MHSLAFRVMRLCQPDLPAEHVFGLDLSRDFLPDDLASHIRPLSIPTDNQAFANRAQTQHPACGVGTHGFLELPQNFGSIFLGESFASYISVGNYASQAVKNLVIKAELQSGKAKVVLYDTSLSPRAQLLPGERHDFLIRHDIKEVSAYTLICSTSYVGQDEEAAYQPQYFKFTSLNPLNVRTKLRPLQQQRATLLEACVENCTGRPLLLAGVRFDAAPGVAARPVTAGAAGGGPAGPRVAEEGTPSIPPVTYADSVQVINAGGSGTFLYLLTGKPGTRAGLGTGPVGSALGKLDIRWQSNLGNLGRLQTQQIMAGAGKHGDASLSISRLPQVLVLEEPALAQLEVRNCTARALGGLLLRQPEDLHSSNIVLQGLAAVRVPDLEPHGSVLLTCTLLPMKDGLQRFPELQLCTGLDDRVLDSLSATDVCVATTSLT